MSTEAMTLALGKIKSVRDCHFKAIDALLFEAEEILEAALAQPQQEPVRVCNPIDCQYIDGFGKTDCDWCRPKACPPAQRTWVGLTDEELAALWYRFGYMKLMRAVEAKVKEKNT